MVLGHDDQRNAAVQQPAAGHPPDFEQLGHRISLLGHAEQREQKDWVSGEEVTYTYDALLRLASAVTTEYPSVSRWGQSYGYDGFGNLSDQNVTKGSAPTLHVVYNPATNRLHRR